MNAIHSLRNNGKRDLYGLDKWDRQRKYIYVNNVLYVILTWNMLNFLVIERDFRLTGEYRKQTDKPTAPEEFKTNSFWKVCDFISVFFYYSYNFKLIVYHHAFFF